MAFLDDSKGFVYLVLKFIQLIFRQSSINEYYVSPLLCMVLFMSFDNEGWAILLIVVCHMMYNMFVTIKVALFDDVVIKISS